MQHADKRKIFLHPGDFIFAEAGTHIHTLLGSCIAITLWHPHLQIGGMCHFVLPSRPHNEPNLSKEPDGRYADEAMELFLLAAKLHQTDISEYQAKIFGGADMFATNKSDNNVVIGEKNTNQAVYLLAKHRIDVLLAHVGESGSRRIVMDMHSGDVWVKHTNSSGVKMPTTSGIT